MSEAIELYVLYAPVAFEFGRQLGKLGSKEDITYQRNLLRRDTQITDGKLLRQTLTQMGLHYEEGDTQNFWGGPIELQVFDNNDIPWFALGWSEEENRYIVYSLDKKHPQTELPVETQISEQDPTSTLNNLAQQYGYLKSLQTLLKDGYKIQGTSKKQPDGSQVVVLQKRQPENDELHTIKLVFKNNGQANVLTDSQLANGRHGVCPEIDELLESAGMKDYKKRTSPMAMYAKMRSISKEQIVPQQTTNIETDFTTEGTTQQQEVSK